MRGNRCRALSELPGSLQAMEGLTGEKVVPPHPQPQPQTTTTTTTYHISFWTLRPIDSGDTLQNDKLALATGSDIRQRRVLRVTGTYGRAGRSRGSAGSEQTSGTLQRSRTN